MGEWTGAPGGQWAVSLGLGARGGKSASEKGGGEGSERTGPRAGTGSTSGGFERTNTRASPRSHPGRRRRATRHSPSQQEESSDA